MLPNSFKWIGIFLFAWGFATLVNLYIDSSPYLSENIGVFLFGVFLMFYGYHLRKNKKFGFK